MTDSAHGPSDRTRRWLTRIGVDPGLITGRARHVSIELRADSLDPAAETALTLTATLLLRLDELASALHIVTPQDRTVHLPRMPDIPLPYAIATAHAGFTSLDWFERRASGQPTLRLVFSGETSGLLVTTNGWVIGIGTALEGSGNGISAS